LYHIPEKKRTANDFPVSGGGLKRKEKSLSGDRRTGERQKMTEAKDYDILGKMQTH
jgi:hypothetical protein